MAADRLENGGPAFPSIEEVESPQPGHYFNRFHNGLTKREAFAMAAMQGRCVFTQGHGSASIARQAVADADALLAALKEPQS